MVRVARRHQNLADHRNAGKRDLAQDLFPGGHHSPRQHVQILRGQRLFQRQLAGTGFAGEKDHTHGQRFAGVQRKPGRGEQKLSRDPGHDAHPIAALAVGGNGSAVGQTSQRGERLGQDFMGGLVAQRSHESYTAGVVVKATIEQIGGQAALQRI